MHERAIEGAVKRAAQGGDLEVGGFLLGGYHRWAGRPYVDITAQVPALKAESARAQLTFTNEAQRELHEAQEKKYPGTLVLGWYHTHPGYGLFLSAHDQFIHGNFYGGPHHVALVIDLRAAKRHQVGIFVWEADKLTSEPYDIVVYETR
jgi:proteasome lid subunit RPN8/RPN11